MLNLAHVQADATRSNPAATTSVPPPEVGTGLDVSACPGEGACS